MQRPSETKRTAILDAAAHLFATRPFHAVRLDDIAEQAQVGKGTLYVYFESKESLYLSLVRDGFRRLVGRLREQLASGPNRAERQIAVIAEGLVDFAFGLPDLYRVMRTRILTPEDEELQIARRELTELIENTLREGIKRGEVSDPHPELTTQFVLSFVRGALLYPPEGLTRETLRDHIVRVLWNGVRRGSEP